MFHLLRPVATPGPRPAAAGPGPDPSATRQRNAEVWGSIHKREAYIHMCLGSTILGQFWDHFGVILGLF